MKRQVQIMGIVLGFISLIGGLIDIYIQYSNGDSAQWRIPIILIGFGVGLPLFIFPFFEWPGRDNPAPNPSEEEYAQSNLEGGFLSGGHDGSNGSDNHGESGDED